MYISKFIFVIISLHLCHGNFERRLLLTPKEGLQIHGKLVHYRAGDNESIGSIPWENVLKHITYLTLFKNSEDDGKIQDIMGYKQFMQSPYLRMPNDYPIFGDIITIAQGWLEKTNEYRFVEGTCDINCGECVLALWKVQKIRHRDLEKGFRYEMKFSVTPKKYLNVVQNVNISSGHYLRSYILKDDDYPEHFNSPKRKSDFIEAFSNEKQAKIINKNPITSLLNIGEYFKNVPTAFSKIRYNSGPHDIYPTTYRPTYQIKFSKPETVEQQSDALKTLVTHHIHHHFFMNKQDTHLLQEKTAFLGNPDAIHIIDAPNADVLDPQYTNFHPTTTSASPPATPSYLQIIPIFRHMSGLKVATPQTQLTPFKTSEQHIEQIRYSEPDPLYENEGLSGTRASSETVSSEIDPQVERPQTIVEPELIKPKLPVADKSNYTESVSIEKSEKDTTSQPTNTPTIRFGESKTFNAKAINRPVYMNKASINKFRAFSENATEQPILKWKTKRKPSERKPEQRSSESVKASVVTVTPSRTNGVNYEFSTKKSVSKSISVKVGNYLQDVQLTEASPANTKN